MAVYTTIDDPEAYFQVKAYTGTDNASQAFTLDGDTDMQPDLVWIKNRGYANKHVVFDSVRGVNKSLTTDSNAVEVDQNDDGGYLSAFSSDGFTLAEGGSSDNDTNDDRYTYVAWCWKANGSGSAQTDGDIDTVRSTNSTSGFTIGTYTGSGTAGHTVGHGLSANPDLLIVKERGNTNSFAVSHKGMTNQSHYIALLNSTDAQFSDDWWNETAPTTSVFSTNGTVTNRSSGTYVFYAWKEVQGFSKFSSYTGNGNASGTFVYTGFRPAWVMIKTISGADRWVISDNKRDIDNPIVGELNPNATTAEDTASTPFDFLSNGFKLRRTGDVFNTSGNTYIYVAFAEAPLVNSNGVPCNAR